MIRSLIEEQFFREVRGINPALTDRCVIKVLGKKFYPDVLIRKHNIIFEFYGDYWHANPKKYKAEDKIKDKTAKEIWEHDRKREEALCKLGFKVIIVWESDYKEQKNLILRYIKHLLQG